MMRIGIAATGLALAAIFLLRAPEIRAQAAPSEMQVAQAAVPAEVDPSGPRRARRPLRRVPIYPREQPDGVYPRYDPGPNAVRDCSVEYVQEFRPSGTVITPHMHCFWRRG